MESSYTFEQAAQLPRTLQVIPLIHVNIDFTHASAEEIEAFYALPGVGRALDSLSQPSRSEIVLLILQTPEPNPSPDPRSDHV